MEWHVELMLVKNSICVKTLEFIHLGGSGENVCEGFGIQYGLLNCKQHQCVKLFIFWNFQKINFSQLKNFALNFIPELTLDIFSVIKLKKLHKNSINKQQQKVCYFMQILLICVMILLNKAIFMA